MTNILYTKIVPYQYDWPKKFQTEKEKLLDIVGGKALEVEHIGSTSIEGLSSKPIIDIVVMIENYQDANIFTGLLSKIGYKFDSSSTERHYYIKGNPIEYHLSIAYADRGGFWARQILFRNYLRNHTEARDEYSKLKESLLQKDPTGGDEYIVGKSDFVYKILSLAGWKEGQKYIKANKKVLILSGPGGSGKTTIAELLMKQCDFVYLDGDNEDTEFFPNGKQWLPENSEKLGRAHDKILKKTKELFTAGNNVVVDYIIFGRYLEFFEKFKREFGDNLIIKILFPSEQETVKRDQERQCWTTGAERIIAVRAEFEAIKNELGEGNYIDTSGETPEITLDKHFLRDLST